MASVRNRYRTSVIQPELSQPKVGASLSTQNKKKLVQEDPYKDIPKINHERTVFLATHTQVKRTEVVVYSDEEIYRRKVKPTVFERIDEQRIWARQLLKETKLKRDKEKLQLEIEKLRHEQEKKEIEVLEDDDDGDDGLNIEEEEDNNLTKNSLKSNQNNSAIMEIKERKLLAMRDNTQAHKMPKKYQLRFLAVKLSMGMHVHDGRSDVSPILPWLLIGRKELSFNLQKLLRLGITHILNCTIDVPNSFPAQFVYQRIPINDSMESDFGKFFPVALEFIGRVAAGKGKILVHCTLGSSRAPTAVMSYLIGMKKLPLLDAFNYVTLIRPCVNPNRKFLLQLAQFEVDQGEGCSVFYHKQWRFYEFNTFRTADIEIRTKLGLTNTLLKLYEESAAGDNLLLE